MTEEQIKQNAEEWVKSLISEEDGGYNENDVSLFLIKNAFIAGAHSRDEEIERIKNEAAAIMDEACALKTELDKLRNPWISVEERLPKVGEFVFVSLANGYVCRGVLYDDVEEIWYVDEYGIVDVTHWMPIPELKKG